MNKFYENNFNNENKGDQERESKPLPDQKTIAYKFLNKLVEKAQGNLKRRIKKRLKEKRGLSPSTIKKFKLGYLDTSIEKELRRQFKNSKLVKTGWYKYECKLCNKGYKKTFTDIKKFKEHVKDEHQYDREENIKEWIKTLLPEQGIVIPYLKDNEKAVYANIRNLNPKENETKYLQPHNRCEETRKTFEGGLFPAYESGADRLVITEGEFDSLAAYEEGHNSVAIAGVGTSESGKKKLASLIKQTKEAVYIADNDIPGLEAIGILAGEMQAKDATIKTQVTISTRNEGGESQIKDLSDMLAQGEKIEIKSQEVQNVLLDSYKKIYKNENALNYVNDVRELFYYSLVNMHDSDKEAWINKLKDKIVNVEDKKPTLSTLRKEGKKFSQEKLEKITERSERSERSERGFHASKDLGEGSNNQNLNPEDFLNEEIPPKKRLSGYIDNNTFFHTLFLHKEGKQRPYIVTSNKELVPIRDKLEEIKLWVKRREDISLKDIDQEKYDYQYFSYGEKTYKLRHRVNIKEELEVYKPNNSILGFFEGDIPNKNIYKSLREKIKTYWDHYNDMWFDVVSAWVVHTYLIMGTGYTVYLLMKGREDTGKSTLQKIIARLAYNGFFTGKSTSAVTSRIAHILQATINQDEFEKLSEDMKTEIQGVYNTGQRKGGKYTFTNTNKSEISDQIEALYSFSPKTLSVNSLHGFASNFLSRNIIIETTRTSRRLANIENIDEEERKEFQRIRNETAAHVLFNHKDILQDIEEWGENLDISGRKADKIGLICGIVKHFEGEDRAEDIQEHLESIGAIQSENINTRIKVMMEYLVDTFVSSGEDEKLLIKVKPKEIADHINRELNVEDDYKASARSVGNQMREYSVLRDNSQVARSSKTGGYVYTITRQCMVDALTRFEMYDLRDRLSQKSSGGKQHPSPKNKNIQKPRSERSERSERSVKSSTRNKGQPSVREVTSYIEEEDEGDGVDHQTVYDEFGGEDIVEDVITKAIDEGLIYEPRPNRLKKL